MSKVLVVAAHPDDEVLGCGGTIARLKNEGADVEILFMGNGRGTTFDNEFDSVSLLTHVKKVELKIESFKPDIIFTHYANDLNIDHRITYQAVITATRPMPGNTVKEIYSFEIPSSTEWAFPVSFSPDVFWNIDDFLDKKIEALGCYESEMRKYPHPRSTEGIEYLAGYRGVQCGCEYAEAFKTVRVIR